jgi:hypothetical protein
MLSFSGLIYVLVRCGLSVRIEPKQVSRGTLKFLPSESSKLDTSSSTDAAKARMMSPNEERGTGRE